MHEITSAIGLSFVVQNLARIGSLGGFSSLYKYVKLHDFLYLLLPFLFI